MIIYLFLYKIKTKLNSIPFILKIRNHNCKCISKSSCPTIRWIKYTRRKSFKKKIPNPSSSRSILTISQMKKKSDNMQYKFWEWIYLKIKGLFISQGKGWKPQFQPIGSLSKAEMEKSTISIKLLSKKPMSIPPMYNIVRDTLNKRKEQHAKI